MYVGISVGACACVCVVGVKGLCDILYGAFGVERVVCVCVYACVRVCACVYVCVCV